MYSMFCAKQHSLPNYLRNTTYIVCRDVINLAYGDLPLGSINYGASSYLLRNILPLRKNTSSLFSEHSGQVVIVECFLRGKAVLRRYLLFVDKQSAVSAGSSMDGALLSYERKR